VQKCTSVRDIYVCDIDVFLSVTHELLQAPELSKSKGQRLAS